MFRKLNNLDLKRPDCALFCRIRNEDYFIPHFLSHYRRLGIEHFYFADDKSTDGTREFLLAQPDCTVIDSELRFHETVGKMKVKDIVRLRVPAELIGDGWTLIVDTDEFAVLPEEYATFGDLARDLDRRGEISCIASMVDFYPRTLGERFASRDTNPFEAFPFFDIGPYFIWKQGQLRPMLLHAGVRHRINEWIFAHNREIWSVYRPTMLNKVPFFRWGRGMLPVGPHHVSIPPYTETQIVLGHFKFYPDLDAKIAEGVESEFYHGSSYYYRVLQLYLPHLKDVSLLSLVTRRYKGPEDLKRARLLFANGRPF